MRDVMSLNCVRNKNQRCVWVILLLVTIIGCGILICVSYIYRGEIKVCLKCRAKSGILPERLIQENCQQPCHSKECVLAANFLLKNMNASADPCEDFYSFACGGMLEKFGEDETQAVVLDMEKSAKLTLKGILENLKESSDEMSIKVKTVYDSCMSDSSSETNAVSSALEFLRDMGIEGWPYLEEDFEFSRMPLEEVIGKMIAYIEFFILDFSPTYEERDSLEGLYNFTIRGSSALMISGSKRKEYEKVIFQILKYLEIDSEKASEIFEDFKSVDEKILQISDYIHVYTGESETPFGVSCKENPNTIICSILKYVVHYTNNTGRYSTDFVYLKSASRIRQHLVMVYDEFSPRAVANYLAVRFFFNHLNDLSTVFRVLAYEHKDLFTILFDFKPTIDKWEYCMNWLLIYMPLSISKVYLLNTAFIDRTEEVQNIFLTSREMAANFTSQQLWIESIQREELTNNMKNMSNELGTLINIVLKNASAYIELFHPTNESFLRNILEFRNNHFKFLSSHIEIDHLLFSPFQTNAFVEDMGVQLTFGLIHPPIFHHGLPKLLNLATLSHIIGHEFGHHIMSYFENLEDTNSSTFIEYGKKLKCLEDQYSNFKLKKIGENVKGSATISENFADLVGYQIFEQIIDKYLEQENNNSALILPAIELPTKQLLYVSMAQMWCETSSEEHEWIRYKYSRYAKPEARIINMLRNLKGFSETFSCSAGSDMNPLHKCFFFEDFQL